MNPKKPKVRLWSVLTALTAILTIAAIVGNMIANQYATTLNVALNASTYKIIKGNTTEDTEYFKAGFASDEEREAYEAELCATVEAEGAALLKNDNAALPGRMRISPTRPSCAKPTPGTTRCSRCSSGRRKPCADNGSSWPARPRLIWRPSAAVTASVPEH